MVKIRLARVGKKKQPTYRFVVSDSLRDVHGHALEILGHYNPFTKVCDVKKDRVEYWIGKGAQLSPTVNNIFVDKNVIQGKKVTASKPGKKPVEAAKPTPAAAPAKPAEEKPAETPAAEEPKAEPTA